MKIHKGDTVIVISGKDKGAKGKVIQAYPAQEKVLVEGVNRINDDEGVRWLYSFLSADKRKTYCLYEAPSPDAIRRAAAAAGQRHRRPLLPDRQRTTEPFPLLGEAAAARAGRSWRS